jgi:hypothetical protein
MSSFRIRNVVLITAAVGFQLAGGSVGAAPLAYNILAPCRLVDTRAGQGPAIADFTIRSFRVQGVCQVPVGAKAVAVNVTAVGATAQGFLTVFASGATQPATSNLNYAAGLALGNGAIVALANQTQFMNELSVIAKMTTLNSGNHVDVIIDVTGYFKE